MTAFDFGNRIAELRNERKLTQADLAAKLNVSTRTIPKWETGVVFPDVQTISEIAHVLDTTTDYLFGRVKKQQMLLCYNVKEADDGTYNRRNYRRKYEAELNDKYLKRGWRIVNSHLSSERETTYMMIVIERYD